MYGPGGAMLEQAPGVAVMKAAFVLSAMVLAAPSLALAQVQPLRLLNPADADRDGVVTDDERADYLAKKAAGARDEPPLPVSAPKAGGNDTIILGKPGAQPGDDAGAAGEPPAAASDFEKSVETKIRKDRED
jgi:hypothetical protein